MTQFHSEIEDTLFNGLVFPMRKLQIDYHEFLMIKALSIFGTGLSNFAKTHPDLLECGLSKEGSAIVKDSKEKYIRVLFKYIQQKEKDIMKAYERMSTFMMFLNTLTVRIF